MSFVSLHNHSMYSNLRLRDAIGRVEEMIDYSHELGHKGICFTEHECITSSLPALKYYASKKKEEGWEDFKVLCGNEIYLCLRPENEEEKPTEFPHFLLIALNARGHEQIRELSSLAWSQSFMSSMMRVPLYYDQLEEHISKEKGNVVASSACLGGAIPKRILQMVQLSGQQQQEYYDSIINWIEYMNDLFGKGYFFLELQPSHNEEQIIVNQMLLHFSKETDTPYIITTDTHYTKADDRKFHKIFLESQDGDREVDDFYSTTYLMDEAEIHKWMDDSLGTEAVQRGIDNTMLIYNMAEDYDLCKPLEIPYVPLDTSEPNMALVEKYADKIKWLGEYAKSEHDSDRHLAREITLAIECDQEQYANQETYDALSVCMDYIEQSSNKMNVRWSAYLLNMSDIIDVIWDSETTLVGAGRGSGVGFILNRLLNITQINPLKETVQTYPWRFMNPERTSVLDIDTDIESSAREAVIQAMKDAWGEDRVSKVMTLSTEGTRSALLSAARGLGIDTDEAMYISSLVVADRGQTRSLHQMYYGDDDNQPVREFVTMMNRYPDLWECAQKFEGLIKGVGSHAGGIIITDKPFTTTTAQMKTNSGDIITQFDLHMCEDVSLIKIDLLSIEALDKLHAELNLLLDAGLIEWQGSLRKTYEKYMGIYTLERKAPDMWQLLIDHKVLSFFQMEKESGIKAISLSEPRSIEDLTALNSVMRLMAQEKGAEQPLDKYARFHKDIREWYREMDEAGLTLEEQDILKEILGQSCGICEAQEYLILLVMHPAIGGFSLNWADGLRKAVAKKKPKDFIRCEEEFFQNMRDKNLSEPLCNYVWNVLISTQKSYGFNHSHVLAYSLIGLQELNMCWKYPILFWSCANLIVDSGSYNTQDNQATDYSKMAVAISHVQSNGTQVVLPLINDVHFGFYPDVQNNRIVFGLKGINGIGTDAAQAILKNAPYKSLEDFCERMVVTKLITNKQMLQLIKAGCFTSVDSADRQATMHKYLWNYVFTPTQQLTLQQFNTLASLGILPKSLELPQKMVNFKKYVLSDEFLVEKHIDADKKMVKRGYHDGYYKLNANSQPFFKEHFTEDSVVRVEGEYYVVSEKLFTKEVDGYIQPLKDWFATEDALKLYNDAIFAQLWDKHASGTIPHWSMQALNYYEAEHELEHVNEAEYGIENYFQLPEKPEIYDTYTRKINGQQVTTPKFRITRLTGTVIGKNDLRCTIDLLTRYGTVKVKMPKGQFAFYNKQISGLVNPDDTKKTILEKGWFTRGTLLLVSGYRQEDNFMCYKYSDSIYTHSVNRILDVASDGTLSIQTERTKL